MEVEVEVAVVVADVFLLRFGAPSPSRIADDCYVGGSRAERE